MATTKSTSTRTTRKAKAASTKKPTTKKENNTMNKNYLFQATPILIFNAKKNKNTNEPIPHAKYYTNEDHTEFFTINDKTTDKPYTTLDTQIIFQTEDNHFYIVHAQLPKIKTITDDYGRTFTQSKNYLRDYTVTPMLQQQGGLDADQDNFTIINTAIDQHLTFTLEEIYYTTRDNQTKTDYRVIKPQELPEEPEYLEPELQDDNI